MRVLRPRSGARAWACPPVCCPYALIQKMSRLALSRLKQLLVRETLEAFVFRAFVAVLGEEALDPRVEIKMSERSFRSR